MFAMSHTRIGKNARAIHTSLVNGTAVLRDTDDKGNKWIEIVRCISEKIMEYKLIKNGKYTYWIKYGKFEKARNNKGYKYIKRFRSNSAKGYHGLTMRYDIPLFGEQGICYTFYSRGHWIWQKFVYANGRVAYDTKGSMFREKSKVARQVEGIYKDGKKLFKIICPNGFTGKTREGYPFNKQDDRTERARYYSESDTAQKYDYSLDGNCEYTIWDRRGRVKEQGKFKNRQKTGEWIEGYKRYFMLNGLKVPKKLYEAKAEDLDPKQVLRESNAQVRAMLLKKIGLERVVKECKGKLIDEDKPRKNALYDFITGTKPNNSKYRSENNEIDTIERILKVKDTSTGQAYFLRIPFDEHFNTCEKARQGTFNGFDIEAKPLEFALET